MANNLHYRDGSIYLISGSISPSISTSIDTIIGTQPAFEITGSGTASITQSHVIYPSVTGSSFKSSITLDSADNSSFIISGSNPSSSFYMSSSGKFGFGTTDPLVSFDIRSDEFQVQKQGKRQGIRVNNEGNIESFNAESTAAATGSEFILSYTRGGTGEVSSIALQKILGVSPDEIADAGGATAFFNGLRRRDQDKILFLMEREGFIASASLGDVLGSIRWIASSGSVSDKDRTAGEAATIQAVVNASNRFGVSADLLFKVADRAALEGASSDLGAAAAPKTALLLDGNFKHELTGSLTITNELTASKFHGDGSGLTNVTATATIPAGTISSSTQIFTTNIFRRYKCKWKYYSFYICR